MNNLDTHQSASIYVDMGLPIIPVCSHDHRGMSVSHKERCKSPGKSPYIAKWTQKGSTTHEEVDQWIKQNAHINLGMALGQSDNWNIVGVDIDGELGAKTWEELNNQHGTPDTWEFITGGGGHRLLFSLPDGLVTKKHKVCYEEGSHEELAFIATGQQTVLPPSMHASGQRYLWVDGKSPQDIDIAMAPQWIIELVQVAIEGPEDIPNFYGDTLSKPVTALEYNQSIYDGTRSDYMARFVGSLCAKRELPKDTILATAMQQNLIHCKPPLEETAIVAMVESIWQSEQEKHQRIIERQRIRQEMNPSVLAELFFKESLNEGVYYRYYSERQTFYKTEIGQGPWVQQSDDQMETDMQIFLLKQDAAIATTSQRLEVLRALRLYIMINYGDGDEFDVGRHPNMKYIAVPNGLLNWQTKELIPWDPEFRHTALINANWREDDDTRAAMKVWTDALNSWLPDPKTIQFLQEYIGYSLLPSCKMRTAVFLYGEGANGKSLFIDVVLKLFEQSYAVAQPSSLTGRFGTTALIDKMMIVCSDIDASYLDRTGVLKQIIAGDEIRGEYKGGKDFGFVPIGKMLFSANKLPKSSDRSFGWYSRLQFVPFPHRFKACQKYYTELMTTMDSDAGRSALLSWAVEGLHRVSQNSSWTISNDMLIAKNEYRKDNDSVISFADTFLTAHPIASESYKTSLILRLVYSTYRDWCEDSGVKPVGQAEFSSRLSQCEFEKKPLRWKDHSGKWKTAISLVDVTFVEDMEFDAKAVYESYVRVAI